MSQVARCSVRHCGDPIKAGGFVCVACGDAYCSHHAARSCAADIKTCDDCIRQCAGCQAVKPVTEGKDVGQSDFLCNTCLAGSAVLSVELGPLDVAELMTPLRPIYEEPNQVCN